MKKLRGLHTLLYLFTCAFTLQAQNPFVHHFTTFDGLPSNQVYQVYQDSRKFIWFVTDAGVSRFDGSKFTNLSKQDGLSCNDVVHVKEDASGRIWFFNMDATLDFYRDGIIYNSMTAPFLDSLKSVEFFRDFYEDENHTLYFYYNYLREIFALDTNNHVSRYKLESLMVNDTLHDHAVEGMVIRYLKKIDGWFYLWTVAGLCRLSDFSQEPVLLQNSPCYKAVYPGRTGPDFVMISSKAEEDSRILRTMNDLELDPSFDPIVTQSDFISAVLQDTNGDIWISTYDEGVFCYRGTEVIRHFDIKEAQAIIQDHEKNIWITSLKEGVYLITPFINQHRHYEPGTFNNHGVMAMAHCRQGGIWLTNGEDVYLLKGETILTMDRIEHNRYLDQILQVEDQRLAIGEVSTVYYAVEGISPDFPTGKVHYTGIKTSPTPLKKLKTNRNGTEISTWNFFAIVRMKPRLFDDFDTYYLGERVFNTFYNAHNELVVNAKKNFILRDNEMVPARGMEKFDERIVSGHLVIEDSVDIYNVEGDSIYLQIANHLYNLTSLWNNTVNLQIKYLEYHGSTLFIGTSRNIYYCNNPREVVKGNTMDLKMLDISFRNIHDILFDEGRLYIASDDGLTAISANLYGNIYASAPIPYFRSVQINDFPQQNNRLKVALTGRNKIMIDFSSINYSFSPVIYSYMLEGLDKSWQTGKGVNVVYENLPKGEYVFKLKARKSISGWSDVIEYQIRIKAPFYKQPLFFVLLSVIFAGFLSVVIIRRKNAELRRREIEHQLVILEQRALQSMMNPHFIFNSLGSIQHYLLQSKPAEAGMYLSQFARLIRQNLNAISAAMISLDEEQVRLQNYLELERMRMEKECEYTIEVDDELSSEEILIPSMIVQPFVENSIWHGIAGIEGKGKISICFKWHDDRTLRILVEDNGIGMKPSEMLSVNNEKHLNIGMSLVLKRLNLLGKKYGTRTGIEIRDAVPGAIPPGTCIEIIVPYIIGSVQKTKGTKQPAGKN